MRTEGRDWPGFATAEADEAEDPELGAMGVIDFKTERHQPFDTAPDVLRARGELRLGSIPGQGLRGG